LAFVYLSWDLMIILAEITYFRLPPLTGFEAADLQMMVRASD